MAAKTIEVIKNPQPVKLLGGGTHIDLAIVRNPDGSIETILHQRQLPARKK